jgi:hypothetical protein
MYHTVAEILRENTVDEAASRRRLDQYPMGRYVPALTGTAADSLKLASIQGREAVSFVP